MPLLQSGSRGFKSLYAYVTDAAEIRAKLDWAITDLGSAITIIASLESTVERIKQVIQEVGHGSSHLSTDVRLIQSLNRTLQELSSMYARFQMMQPALEEWRNGI